MNKRVVITGMGTTNPLGNNVKNTWQNAVEGKSGAAAITKFDPSPFNTRFACEVKDFQPDTYLERAEIKRSDLFTQYALYSSAQALEDSGIDMDSIDPFDIGVIWGSGQGGMITFEEEIKSYAGNLEKPRFNPFFVPKIIPNMSSGMISMKFGVMGINYTTVSACATSNTALMDAYHYLKLGKAKAFITGGSEAPITAASIGGFTSMKAMSTRNEEPAKASRPFDVDRDGFVMGEGAGAFILEEYEHAKKRNAPIYAEVIGAAMTADAYHMTAPHPDGKGALKAMEIVLKDAELNPDEVNYINTHATSTPVGDLAEIKAITALFGASPQKLKISATKSMTGHLLGAAGAVEGILSVLAIKEGIIPPTINTTNLDPQIPKDLQIVTGEAVSASVEVALSNTFGFGGHNAIVAFRKI